MTLFKKGSKGFGDYVEIKLLRKKYYIHMSQGNDPPLFIGLYSGIFTPKVRIHILPKRLCYIISCILHLTSFKIYVIVTSCTLPFLHSPMTRVRGSFIFVVT